MSDIVPRRGSEIDRQPYRGEVLDSVTIEIREDAQTGAWRLYTYGEGLSHDRLPLSRKIDGRKHIFGGTRDEAERDARMLCAEGGFMLRRSSGLLLP